MRQEGAHRRKHDKKGAHARGRDKKGAHARGRDKKGAHTRGRDKKGARARGRDKKCWTRLTQALELDRVLHEPAFATGLASEKEPFGTPMRAETFNEVTSVEEVSFMAYFDDIEALLVIILAGHEAASDHEDVDVGDIKLDPTAVQFLPRWSAVC